MVSCIPSGNVEFWGRSFMQLPHLKWMKYAQILTVAAYQLGQNVTLTQLWKENGNSPTTSRKTHATIHNTRKMGIHQPMKDGNIQLFIVPEALRAEHQAFGNTSLGGRSRVHCQNGGTSWSQGLSQITVLRQDFRKEPWKWGKHSVFTSTNWISFWFIFHAHFHAYFLTYFCKRPWFLSCNLLKANDTKKLSTCCRLHHFSCPFGWLISTTSLRRSSGNGSFQWEVVKWSATTWSQHQHHHHHHQQQPSTNSQNSLWNDVKTKVHTHTHDLIELNYNNPRARLVRWCPSLQRMTLWLPMRHNRRSAVSCKHGIFPFGGFPWGRAP